MAQQPAPNPNQVAAKTLLQAADDKRTKTPDMLHAFGKAVDHLGGRYVTAEDVGMDVTDMIEIARNTKYVAGLPAEGKEVGGDPAAAAAGFMNSLVLFVGAASIFRSRSEAER